MSEDWTTWRCSACDVAIRPVTNQRDWVKPTDFYHPGGGLKGDHHGGKWEGVRRLDTDALSLNVRVLSDEALHHLEENVIAEIGRRG